MPGPSLEALRARAEQLVQAEQWDAAADALSQIVRRDVEDAWPYATLGGLLHRAGDTDRAIALYESALERDPFQQAAILNLLKPLMERCDWSGVRVLRELLDQLRSQGAEWRDFINPFNAVVLPLSRADQKDVSGFHARRIQESVGGQRVERGPRRADGRARIGYLSADFHNHATAHLTASMYGLHDRTRFEVYAYSIDPDVEDHYRRRIRESCDQFVDLSGLSDHDAAQRIARDGVDILVDLKGYTRGDRARILSYRPAPIQVHYLGYPGPLAAPFIDYSICDGVVVPPAHGSAYPEALVRLSPCYQINDSRQPIDPNVPTRTDCGLPGGAVVLCAFSQSYKIEPLVFDVWMRVLRELPAAVLWLLVPDATARVNLVRESEARGVAASRLVFGRFEPKARHLARIGVADLGLDTFFCNGHTTCSDMLWAGVPILTCPAEAFAGRVGASVVAAGGLRELVVPSLERYAELAIELCREPARIRGLKQRLQEVRSTCALFDTGRTTRQLESAYEHMCGRARAGLVPESFNIEK
jgi:predicted O-linked N-acetylglucosamine transferase (SPINDLY family)